MLPFLLLWVINSWLISQALETNQGEVIIENQGDKAQNHNRYELFEAASNTNMIFDKQTGD